MEINRENILEVCRKSNIHPSKDYGQNFLVEPNLSKRIVDALEISKEDKVLEIGPGLGSLTHFLSLYDNQIDVVDIDLDMINFLNVVYKNNNNINIINKDIRKHDVSGYTKIVANLPYNITTEVITYLMLNAKECKKMILMCQNETFLHFYNTSKSEYGPTSILIHLLGEINKVCPANKGCFYPVPKVDSIVFSIDINKDINDEIVNAYKVSKQLFLNRRKTIYNNLNNVLKDKDKARYVLTTLKIEENLRPEQISPEMFLKISSLINNIK